MDDEYEEGGQYIADNSDGHEGSHYVSIHEFDAHSKHADNDDHNGTHREVHNDSLMLGDYLPNKLSARRKITKKVSEVTVVQPEIQNLFY